MGLFHSKRTPEQETELLKQMLIPVIWVIGSPGSGRTTQCNKLVDRFLFWKVSIPQIIEDRVHHLWSKRGRALSALLNRNELIPRDFLLEMVREDMLRYIDRSSGYLIDGFPRNLEQAERLAEFTASPSMILFLKCSIATAKKRLRDKYPGPCSLDEADESIHRRMMVFHTHLQPILERYADIVVEINAEGSPREVNKECRLHIQKLFENLGIQIPSMSEELGADEESSEDEDN